MVEALEHKRRDRPFVFLHVGDLHLTELAADTQTALTDREARLQADVRAIFENIASIANDAFDFVYLPGDLAENAGRAEYTDLADALKCMSHAPLCLIPGDHDRARGSLDEFARFRKGLRGVHKQPASADRFTEIPLGGKGPPADCLSYHKCTEQFYYSKEFAGVLCLFLDMVSAGFGQKGIGLDFRLGAEQAHWVKTEIGEAKRHGQPCAVFMHCYPADIHDPSQVADLAGLFWDGGVRLVEMGHTHYNEIAHDGRTQYATARSVGQNEDGPVGYAVVALDGDVTSWRFKQLQQTWPFVLITSPADRRLATGPLSVGHDHKICVRALILTDQLPSSSAADIRPACPKDPWDDATDETETTLRFRAWCSVDDGEYVPMDYKGDCMFELWVDWRPGSKKISVNATDGRWKTRMQDFIDLDSIEPAAIEGEFEYRTKPDKLGSGAFQVGPWPVKGIRGDQLGPNNGGRKW